MAKRKPKKLSPDITDERQIQILNILQEAETPIGSYSLMDTLEKIGIKLSPATIGRLLSDLDKNGLVERKSFKGRIITKRGENALKRSQNQKVIDESKEQLTDLINSDVLHHFLDVLVARKAISVEVAGLAAQNITPEEIEKLQQLEQQRIKDYDKNIRDPEVDIEFHRVIARASRNQALVILSEMIIALGQQSVLFDEMRNDIDKPYFISHEKIIRGLRRGRQKETEQAMLDHVNTLISDVRKYWQAHDV